MSVMLSWSASKDENDSRKVYTATFYEDLFDRDLR